MNWLGVTPAYIEIHQQGKLIAVVTTEESADAVVGLCLTQPPHCFHLNEYNHKGQWLGGESWDQQVLLDMGAPLAE